MINEQTFRELNPHYCHLVDNWTFEYENQRLAAPDELHYTSTDDGRIQTIEYHPEKEFEWNRFQRRYRLVKERATFETVRYWHYEDVLAALTRDEISQELWDEVHAAHCLEMSHYIGGTSMADMASYVHEGRISQSTFEAYDWLFRHSAVRFSDQHQRGGAPDALAIPFAFDYPMCEIERWIHESSGS